MACAIVAPMTDLLWPDPEIEYQATLDRAATDPMVVGVVVFGSRAADAFVTDRSDVDAFVVVDGATADAARWQTPHGSPVEIWAVTLEQFRAHGLPGSPTAWNRPAFVRARVDLDRLDGEIERIVDRKRRLDPEEAAPLVELALDDAINTLDRALRNLEGGREVEGRLDAVEAIAPILTTAFALEGRVRPFNKWLRYELERGPLGADGATLVEAAQRILDEQTTTALRIAFRRLETAARASGHGAVVETWEPDVAWLRGETPDRPGASRSSSRNP